MIAAFKTRRAWAAAALAFLLGPFVGMLYLNRGRLALIYLGVGFAVAAARVATFPHLSGDFVNWNLYLFVFLPIQLIGATHAYALARRRAPEEAMRWYSRWYALVAILLVFPVVALAVRTFLFQTFDARSSSMSPTLNAGDYFFVEKFAYAIAVPQRGDLIVFRAAEGTRTVSYVKRIVALPGDRVQLISGRLYINGGAVGIAPTPERWAYCEFGECRTVPEYFESLPGGARHRIVQISSDGPLDNTQVFSVPAGSYFVLGDNRDNSNDSRGYLGFIPVADIVGRVAVKYVDGRQHRLVWQGVN